MAASVLTLRLPEDTKAKLDKLAQATRRSRSFLAEEAITRYLELEAWQVGEIELALAEADRGEFATEADLQALLKSHAG